MKILIAEDDLILRTLLEELLGRWSHEVIACEDGREAMAKIDEGVGFDVAILDWMMPGAAGIDVCKRIRESSSERRPYVIMLTAKSQLEDLVNGLDAGADDYLTKPYRTPELSARLRAAERLMRMQDDLIKSKLRVAYQTEHDAHTDTLNRGTFLARVHRILMDRQHQGRALSIARADIAAFGSINEEYGIEVGDEVLRAFAQRVTLAVPADALVARTGGDELSILLPDADEAAGEEFCASLYARIREEAFETAAGSIFLRADVSIVTAASPGEFDLGWLLCALDAIAVPTAHEGSVRPLRSVGVS